MSKPNFSKKYQNQVLESVLNYSLIRDREYWKEKIESEFKDAKERYQYYKSIKETYPEDDYGFDVEMDTSGILEAWDDQLTI